MPQEPAPADPGRDEPRPGDPMQDAPYDWEPVITRPDPMTEEEREAWLDALAGEDEPFDPEEYPDPEGPPPPGEDELTAEEIAGIREATEAEAQAAANGARLGATGALAVIAALAGRRGPGQPGSARRFPASPPAGRRRSAPGWRWTSCPAAPTWRCSPMRRPGMTTGMRAPRMMS